MLSRWMSSMSELQGPISQARGKKTVKNPEIEREHKDKQPLPACSSLGPSHVWGLLLLFNAASTELLA